jgi:hypothetical protein
MPYQTDQRPFTWLRTHDSLLVDLRDLCLDWLVLVVTPLELMLDTTGSGFSGFLHLAWFTSLLFSYPIKLPVIDILPCNIESIVDVLRSNIHRVFRHTL